MPVDISNNRNRKVSEKQKSSEHQSAGHISSISTESETNFYGWYKYGCAGYHKCLPVGVLSMASEQPSGNIFCFSNYGTLDAAKSSCQIFNQQKSGSCTHIASYQLETGDKRWELLNIRAEEKCKKYFDSETIQISAFPELRHRRRYKAYFCFVIFISNFEAIAANRDSFQYS